MTDDRDVYYLSFATNEGWLGGCYARGWGEVDAVAEASTLGINPGGEVAIVGPLPPGVVPDGKLDQLYTNPGDLEFDGTPDCS